MCRNRKRYTVWLWCWTVGKHYSVHCLTNYPIDYSINGTSHQHICLSTQRSFVRFLVLVLKQCPPCLRSPRIIEVSASPPGPRYWTSVAPGYRQATWAAGNRLSDEKKKVSFPDEVGLAGRLLGDTSGIVIRDQPDLRDNVHDKHCLVDKLDGLRMFSTTKHDLHAVII